MADGSPRRRKTRSVSASMIVGALLVPVSAVVALALIGDEPAKGVEPLTTTAAEIPPPSGQVAYANQQATPEDLQEACGEAGSALVIAEEQETITDVQQAALDALREICEEQGMPLPGKPAPDPIINTVVVTRSSTSSNSSSDEAQEPAHTEHEEEYEEPGEEEEYEEHGEKEHEESEHHEEHEDDYGEGD